MKKLISLALVLVMLVALVAVSANAEDKLTLKFVEQLPEGHIMSNTQAYFAEKVEELSNGTIDVELYTGGVLGDDTAMQEAVQLGTIDVIRVEYTTLVNFGAKKVVATTLPYVFRDRDHYWAFAKSDVGEELLASVQEDGTGMVGLCMVEEGARHFFSSKALDSIEDVKGQKIRVQDTDMWVSIVNALGASATPMSFSELYTAMSSGTVDAAEQPLSGYVSNKLYEVGPNLILDGHVYPAQAYVMSEVTWNKLTDEQKAIIKEAANLASDYNRENIIKVEEDLMASLSELGVNVVEVADKGPWVEAMAPVYEKFGDADTLAILARIQAVE